MVFNPSRLTLARVRRGKTKKDLAEGIGMTIRSLSGYESGDFVPSEGALAEISRELKFPVEFFFGSTIDIPDAEGVSFRSMASMTASKRNAALGAAAIGVSLSEWIGKRYELPEPDLPPLRGHTPESAADALRAGWGMGERPVKNMVHLLEAHGVRVFSLAEKSRELDAFSFWLGSTPFVFLNTQKSAEHGRFDAAHELGHLIMHKHGGPRGKGSEHEADRFASSFLMPMGSLLPVAPRLANLNTLIALKVTWNVSVAALNYRLHALRLTSDWQFRNACIEINRSGYRTAEPDGAPRECSQVLQKVFQDLRDEGIGKADVARELCINTDELDTLVFGLVLTLLPGGAKVPTPRSPGANLRRV